MPRSKAKVFLRVLGVSVVKAFCRGRNHDHRRVEPGAKPLRTVFSTTFRGTMNCFK